MHLLSSLSVFLPENLPLAVAVDQVAVELHHGAAGGEDLAGALQLQPGHQDQQLDGETELPGHAHLALVTPPVTLSHGPEHTTSTRSFRTQAISLSLFGNAVTHVTHDIMTKISNHGDQDKDILTRTTDVPEVLTVQCVHSV